MKCPFCGANIYDDINRCQYCGCYIDQNNKKPQAAPSPEQHIHINVEQPSNNPEKRRGRADNSPRKKKNRLRLFAVLLVLILWAIGSGGNKNQKSSSQNASTTRPSATATAKATNTPAPTDTPVPEVVTGLADKTGQGILDGLVEAYGLWPDKREVNTIGYDYNQWVQGDGSEYKAFNFIYSTDENDRLLHGSFMITPRDAIGYFHTVLSMLCGPEDLEKVEAFISSHTEKGEATIEVGDMLITHDHNDTNYMLKIWQKDYYQSLQ